MERKRICIVGAGVSGIVTAKVFLSEGHDVTVFEQIGTLGGVWAPARHYPGVRLQTKCQHYAYSDFPMPPDYPEFPSGAQVYDYLCAYAARDGVDRVVRFRTEVRGVTPRPDGKPGWRVAVRSLDSGEDAASDFDFVVICNGLFCDPQIPDFPGREEFEANGGVVLHSSQLHDEAALRGRDVVVVGFGKSALDLAEASVAVSRSTSIVYRRVPWKVPHRLFGRINIKHFILTRFTEIWFPHPDMGVARRFMHRHMRFLVSLFFRGSEFLIGRQLGLFSADLRPDTALRNSAPCITLAVDNLRMIREGRIARHRDSIARFTSRGLELKSGRSVDAQVVVLATGYRQGVRFLGERERAKLVDSSGAVLLYRSLVNPDIPDMAFNGYNGVGISQLVAEIGAVWLARLVEGRMALPSQAVMHDTIRAELELRRRLVNTGVAPGTYVTPFSFGYLDQLLRDLGLPSADRHRRFFDWLFTPLQPSDYSDVLERSRVVGRERSDRGQPALREA